MVSLQRQPTGGVSTIHFTTTRTIISKEQHLYQASSSQTAHIVQTYFNMAGAPDSVALLLFFVFWYAGNMKYNEYNTAALNAVGGKTSGLTMTVATMQLGVCAIYATIMWIVKINPAKIFGLQMPEKQSAPKTTTSDLIKSLPLAFCAAGAHAATVFALGGDPLFGQIGK